MSIEMHSLSKDEFDQKLQKFLEMLEGKFKTAYADTAKPSHPTIGIGFDLTVTGVRNKVFEAMGIDPSSSLGKDLANAIRLSIGKSTLTVQEKLDGVYEKDFVMTENEIAEAFKKIAKSYVDIAMQKTGLGYSTELVAIASATFNGLLGPGLVGALTLADPDEARAEAWYQIRYSHADQLHKRRYAEAAEFGLYDGSTSPLTVDQAFAIYKMYTAHATTPLPGSPGGMAAYDYAHRNEIRLANIDLGAGYESSSKVGSIGSVLRPSATKLLEHAFSDVGQTLPIRFDPLNIHVTGQQQVTFEEKDAKGIVVQSTIVQFTSDAENITIIDKNGNRTNIKVDKSGVVTTTDSSGEHHSVREVDKLGNVKVDLDDEVHQKAFSVDKDGAIKFTTSLSVTDDSDMTARGFDPLYQRTLARNINESDDLLSSFSRGADGAIKMDVSYDDIAASFESGALGEDYHIHASSSDGYQDVTYSDGTLIIQIVDSDGQHTFTLKKGSITASVTGPRQEFSWEATHSGITGSGFRENHDGEVVRLYFDTNGYWMNQYFMTHSGQWDRIEVGSSGLSSYMPGDLSVGDNGSVSFSIVSSDMSGAITDEGFQISIGEVIIKSTENSTTFYSGQDKLAWSSDGGYDAIIYDKSGALYTEKFTSDDQIRIIKEVATNGNEVSSGYRGEILQYRITSDESNNTETTEFYDNGNLYRRVEKISDGTIITTKFGIVSTDTTYTDKAGAIFNVLHEHDDGSISQEETKNNGDKVITEFDPGHNKVAEDVTFKDGGNKITVFVGESFTPSMTYVGNAQDNLVIGTSGDDKISGLAGSDTLIGGRGNDFINGGEGSDLYRFSKGDGSDTIIDEDRSGGSTDTIELDDVGPDNVSVQRVDSDLLLKIIGTEDSIKVIDWFSSEKNSIEQVKFQDGTIWNVQDLIEKSAGLVLQGSDADDRISGTAVNDSITGGSGNDILLGGHGADTYVFSSGHGNDTVIDVTVAPEINILKLHDISSSLTTVIAQRGDLIIKTGEYDSISLKGWMSSADNTHYHVQFDDGTLWDSQALEALVDYAPSVENNVSYGSRESDWISGWFGDDIIYGRDGDDWIAGGDGNDLIYGSVGADDLYGDGGDDIFVYEQGDGIDTIHDQSYYINNDAIVFGSQISTKDVLLAQSENDLIISFRGSETDLLIVSNWFDVYSRVEELRFSDGTVWDVLRIKSELGLDLEANNQVIGTDDDDYLSGTPENDDIYGGLGNDFISGGSGDDVYLFEKNEGFDLIAEVDFSPNDKIKFGQSVSIADVSVGRDLSDLILKVGEAGEIHILSWFESFAPRLSTVQFADGSVWNSADLLSRLGGATEGPDFLGGTDSDDMLIGQRGDDWLSGGGGADTLIGGVGADIIIGGEGDDTIIFNKGDGHDILEDFALTEDRDILKFGSQISSSDISLSRSQASLYISLVNSDDHIEISNWFYSDFLSKKLVTFEDGMVLDSVALNERIKYVPSTGSDYLIGSNESDTIDGLAGDDTIYGYAGDDSIYGGFGLDDLNGGSGSDQLYGGQGDDYIKGNEGSDILVGGSGHDDLYGGLGADTYVFSAGDDDDYVYEEYSENNDRNIISFDSSVNPSDVVVSQSQGYLILEYGADDKVFIADWEFSNQAPVELVTFANGTVWDVAKLISLAADEMGTDVASVGSSNTDLFVGLRGNDPLWKLGGVLSTMGIWNNTSMEIGVAIALSYAATESLYEDNQQPMIDFLGNNPNDIMQSQVSILPIGISDSWINSIG